MVISVRSPIVPAGAALIAALVRWWVQGSTNVYTAVDKRFYVPDPDLGWRVSAAHPVWLGLDVCAVLAALAIALGIAGWLIGRRELERGATAKSLRAVAWLFGAISLAVPIAAFASGGRPTGARDALPIDVATSPIANRIAANLDAPAGTYDVIAHAGTSVTAHVTAGGEGFDARFADVRGSWRGDPHDLAAPMTATVSVAAASVDTGVTTRSRHARTGYLEADTFPRIEVALERVLAAQPAAAGGVAFAARGTLALMGRTHPIEVSGTIRRADPAALARLGLDGTILLVTATFSIPIDATALAAKAGDFNGNVIPISVSLVLKARP